MSILHKFATILALCFFPTGLFAQTISCGDLADNPADTTKRLQCLDEQVADLQDRIKVVQDAVLKLLENQADQIAKQAESLARPNFVRLPEFVHATRGFWAGGGANQLHVCKGYEPNQTGYTLVEIRNEVRVMGRGTCAPSPFCDSAGEFCHDVLVRGCYVRSELLPTLREKFGLDDATILNNC